MFKVVGLVCDETMLHDLPVGCDETVRAALVGRIDLRLVQQPLPFEDVHGARGRVGQHRRSRPADIGDAREVPAGVSPEKDLRVPVIGREDRHRRHLSRVLDRLVRADITEQDVVVLGQERGGLLVAGCRTTRPDLEVDPGTAELADHPILVLVDRRVRAEKLVGEPLVRLRPPARLDDDRARAEPLQRRGVAGRGRGAAAGTRAGAGRRAGRAGSA